MDHTRIATVVRHHPFLRNEERSYASQDDELEAVHVPESSHRWVITDDDVCIIRQNESKTTTKYDDT